MSVLTGLGGYGSGSSSDESDTEKEEKTEKKDSSREEEKSLHLKVSFQWIGRNVFLSIRKDCSIDMQLVCSYRTEGGGSICRQKGRFSKVRWRPKTIS